MSPEQFTLVFISEMCFPTNARAVCQFLIDCWRKLIVLLLFLRETFLYYPVTSNCFLVERQSSGQSRLLSPGVWQRTPLISILR